MKMDMKAVIRIWPAGLFLLFSGCSNKDDSLTGPDASGFKSSYSPITKEYWITTETAFKWDMVPSGESMMTKDVISPERRYLFKTIRYVQTDSEWNPISRPDWQQLSGPIIRATVGDSVVVHFKNGNNTGMPLSIHPHNLVYDEANEGVWRKDRPLDWPDQGTAGGSVKPGDEFTYHWKAEAKSVGVGPYHSHSFKPAEEISLGLIGTIIVDQPPDHPDYVKFDTTISLIFKTYLAMVSPKDTTVMDSTRKDTCPSPLIPWNGGCHPKEHVPMDQWPENIVDSLAHGGGPEVQTINGISYANLNGLNFKKGQNVRFVVVAMNDEGTQNHTVHFHGEMLREMSRRNLYKDVFDLPSAVAIELMMKAENIGKWMLHCHVEHHASEMMATYEIAPLTATANTTNTGHSGH
jgi:FtsP/CotA-like multicopper oxidase with cupredoxin domain